MTDAERKQVQEETLALVQRWISQTASSYDVFAGQADKLGQTTAGVIERAKANALRRFSQVYLET